MRASKKRQRNKQPTRAKEFERLKRKLNSSSLPPHKIVVEPAGHVKMSDVLSDFVAPYRDYAETMQAYRRLLTLAVAAWNAALFPETKQQEVVDEVLSHLPGETRLKSDVKALLYELIERKVRFFPQYERAIISFELTETRNGYHLSVASTLDGDIISPPLPATNRS